LGLGGEPRLLGRADQVETFIQNGEDDAEIELEVANEHGDDVVITRVIRKGESKKNRTTFTWNGETISGKKVRERASERFQIQIDNLCTFLPQEKVGSFSGINSKDLLLETEKTLSENHDLYNTHLKLISMQEELQGGDNQVDNLNAKLENLEAEIKKYKIGVDKMEERKKAEEQADLLRKKILWLKCDAFQDKALALKKINDEAKENVAQLESKLEPLEQSNNVAKERLTNIQDEVNAFDKQITTHKNDMKKEEAKYQKHDDKIEEILIDITGIDTNRSNTERKAEDLRTKVEDLQNALNESPPIEELEEAFHQAREDQKNNYPMYQKKKSELQELQHKVLSVEDELTNAKRRLDRLQDEKEQRRNHVLRQFKEVKDAYDWIHNNRNLFRKEVIGPIACEISPKSNNAAAYLEQHVPNSTLKSFVVQDKSDYDLLYQKVRNEKKIAINIIQIDRIDQAEPRPYTDQKMAMLKQDHGVVGYLDESFEGPEVVIEALKSSAAIHKVLVGNDDTQDSLDDRGLGNILSEPENQGNRIIGYCIFASKRGKSFKYTSQISRYSGKPSLRVDDIRPAKMLTKGGNNDVAKQELTQKMQELEDRKNQITPDIQRVDREQQELLMESQNSQQRVKDTKAEIHSVQKVHNKLKNTQRKLSETEEKLGTDDEEQKKELIGDLKKRAIVSLKAMNAHSESYNKVMEATVKASGARLNKELAVVEERTSRYVLFYFILFYSILFYSILFYFKYRILRSKSI
jgi:chromosome segregation ATPase